MRGLVLPSPLYIDLNLIGDPCSVVPVKQQGCKASPAGQAVLKELDAFYINLANWLAWKDRKFYFVFGKNNYGRDEVNDNLVYQSAFYLFLEGFTPNVVASSPPPTFSGSFSAANIPGLVITGPTVTYAVGNTGANANVPQRIRFEYGIQFSSASLASGSFPPSGSARPTPLRSTQPSTYRGKPSRASRRNSSCWAATIHISPMSMRAPAISPTSARIFGCSRVTPTANNQTPIGNVHFTFQGGNPTTLDTAAGYSYIQSLDHLAQ